MNVLYGPTMFTESVLSKYEELYRIFKNVKVLSGGDNVIKLDMLGGNVYVSVIRDKKHIDIVDTVEVKWYDHTDEIEPFGFIMIDNSSDVYGPYHIKT